MKEDTSKITTIMTVTPKKARPPRYIIFEIKIANKGSTILNNVNAFGQISLGAKYISDSLCGKVSQNNVEWLDIGSLKPGDEAIIILTVLINNKPGNGFWTSEVRVCGTSEEGDVVENKCSIEVEYDDRKTREKSNKNDTNGYEGDSHIGGKTRYISDVPLPDWMMKHT